MLLRHQSRQIQRSQQIDADLLHGQCLGVVLARIRHEQRCVIHQRLQGPPLRGDVLHHGAARCGVGQVGLHQFQVGALLLQLLLQGLRIGPAAVEVAQHAPASSGKGAAQFGTQAARATGYKNGWRARRLRGVALRRGM